MDKKSIIVLEDSAFFNRGQLIENFVEEEDGVLVEGMLIPEGKYVLLTEHLTAQDERRIKDLIRAQMKLLFWNLYTKNSIVLGSM